MAEHNVGSPQEQPEDIRPDVYTRVSSALSVEDRDWNTVSRRVATRMLAGGGAALAVMAAGLAGFRHTYASKIYPKTHIGDVNVGGMTADEAIEAVQSRVDELINNGVQYTFEQHTWEPTLTELGISIDVPAAVERAFAKGRDDKAADRLLSTNDMLQDTEVIPLHFSLQPWTLQEWFEKVDTDIDQPAIDATFTVKGADLVITQDSTGIVSDRKTIQTGLMESLRKLEPVAGDLPTEVDQPRITKADLEANEDEVLKVLSNSVTVRFEGARWEIAPAEVSAFMVITSEVEDSRAVTHIDFDRDLLSDFLQEKFVPEVNRRPINATVQFYDGKLTATSEDQDGKTLKGPAFADLVAESFLGNHERVDIPVVTSQAKVRNDNLDTLGIKERICRVDSNYTSDLGTERATNIEVGVRLLNNVIVAPGDEFSFNDAVGSIEINPDFVGGKAIVAGVIQDEFGGGICQVTTTAFRAAIMGGFPITEWYPHTYRLQGYERDGWGPGYDASILQLDVNAPENWADFKFENNTENFILVSSWVDGGIHIIEIYGTATGWDVQLSETSTWEAESNDSNKWNIDYDEAAGTNYASAYPVEGLYASFNRTVLNADGTEMYTRDFTSPYQSRGWQCTCSPDMVDVPCW